MIGQILSIFKDYKNCTASKKTQLGTDVTVLKNIFANIFVEKNGVLFIVLVILVKVGS
jgi:hypothetical protein